MRSTIVTVLRALLITEKVAGTTPAATIVEGRSLFGTSTFTSYIALKEPRAESRSRVARRTDWEFVDHWRTFGRACASSVHVGVMYRLCLHAREA